jgi:hypothetical protein
MSTRNYACLRYIGQCLRANKLLLPWIADRNLVPDRCGAPSGDAFRNRRETLSTDHARAEAEDRPPPGRKALAAYRRPGVISEASAIFRIAAPEAAQNGNPPATIGLSGGIDSALVAALLAIAIGPGRVWAVNMPSRFNSATTRNAARQLAANLCIKYAAIPIQESVEHTIGQVEGTEWRVPGREYGADAGGPGAPARFTLSGLNKENIQARDRGGRVLAAVASAIGGDSFKTAKRGWL